MSSFIRSPLFLVLALWAAGLGSAAQFAKIVVIFPELQAHYGETGAASGYLVSLISVVGMLLGLVAGIIAIQIGIRRLLLSGLYLGAAIQPGRLPCPDSSGCWQAVCSKACRIWRSLSPRRH